MNNTEPQTQPKNKRVTRIRLPELIGAINNYQRLQAKYIKVQTVVHNGHTEIVRNAETLAVLSDLQASLARIAKLLGGEIGGYREVSILLNHENS